MLPAFDAITQFVGGFFFPALVYTLIVLLFGRAFNLIVVHPGSSFWYNLTHATYGQIIGGLWLAAWLTPLLLSIFFDKDAMRFFGPGQQFVLTSLIFATILYLVIKLKERVTHINGRKKQARVETYETYRENITS